MKTTSGQDALTTRAAHGEWTFEHDADGDFGIYWGNKHVCTTVSDTTEDEANARLIIAAPDMLAALKDLKAWLKHHLETNTINRSTGKGGHDGDGNSWAAAAIPTWDARQRIDEIDAAIAKAGGQ